MFNDKLDKLDEENTFIYLMWRNVFLFVAFILMLITGSCHYTKAQVIEAVKEAQINPLIAECTLTSKACSEVYTLEMQ